MPTNLRLYALDSLCNEAINLKKAELLLQNKDLTKEACVYEILYEWLHAKKTSTEQPIVTTLSFNLKPTS